MKKLISAAIALAFAGTAFAMPATAHAAGIHASGGHHVKATGAMKVDAKKKGKRAHKKHSAKHLAS